MTPDQGISQGNPNIESGEILRGERFYQAYKFLEAHPIFDTAKGQVETKGNAKKIWGDIADRSDWDPSVTSRLMNELDQGPDIIPFSDPAFGRSLDVHVVKVDQKTGRIGKNAKRNTKVEIWLETGPYDPTFDEDVQRVVGFTHDIDLDSGGDTFEDAIVQLAEKVKEKYGDLPNIAT